MSRRSGHRFADKDMRQRVNLEQVPIRRNGTCSSAAATFIRPRCVVR
jgi:hypothetical protein